MLWPTAICAILAVIPGTLMFMDERQARDEGRQPRRIWTRLTAFLLVLSVGWIGVAAGLVVRG